MMVSDEEKRWIVVGIAMNKVAAPVLRDAVKQGMDTNYANLDGHCQLLHPPCTLKTLTHGVVQADPILKNLKFQNINNNHLVHGVCNYNFNINSSVDLAKLYLPGYLAQFSAFDESLDMTAILRLLGFKNYMQLPAAVFSTHIQASADDVRENVRNKWGHVDITEWTDALFNDCFDKLKTLVRSLRLTAGVEKNKLDQLDDWKTKGCKLIMGHAVDKDLLFLVQDEVKDLIKDYNTIHSQLNLHNQEIAQLQGSVGTLKDQDERKETKLVEHHKRFEALEEKLQEELENRSEEIAKVVERLVSFETQLSIRLQVVEEKIEQLEQTLTKTDDRVGQLEQNQTNAVCQVQLLKHSHTKTADEVELLKHSHTKTADEVELLKHSHTKTADEVELLKHSHTKTADEVELLKQSQTETTAKADQLDQRCAEVESIGLQFKTHKDKEASSMKPFDFKSCRSKLEDHYRKTATVPTSVWSKKAVVDIHQIYTRLSWVKEEQTPGGPTQSELKHYTELFTADKNGVIPKRILVQGQTGIGKSTFVKKLLVDWVEVNNGTGDEQAAVLKNFELVVAVNLKEVSKCERLTDIIRLSNVFAKEDKYMTEDLMNYITNNQEKVLLIFDGYDEYRSGCDSEIYEIFSGKSLRSCCVLITARISKADELRGGEDLHAEITGFSKVDGQTFMRRFLTHDEVFLLERQIYKRKLNELAKVPLLLLFFCTLWRKGQSKHFPETKAKLYIDIIQFILNHSYSKQSPPQYVEVTSFKEILSEIGKVALQALLKDDHLFEYSQLSDSVRCDDSVLIGLLQITEYSETLRPVGMVSFIHKSIQEFLAAWYITYRCIPEGGNLGEISVKLEECLALENVFQFICGLSDDGALATFRHLTSVRFSDPSLDLSKTVPDVKNGTDRPLSDVTERQWKFSRLVFDLFEQTESKAELSRACFDCLGEILLHPPIRSSPEHVFLKAKETNSWSLVFENKFSEMNFFPAAVSNLNKMVKTLATGSSKILNVGEFLEKFQNCSCNFHCGFFSVLCFRNDQVYFYITHLKLDCDDHFGLFTAFVVPSNSVHSSSGRFCLKFLKTLECLRYGTSSMEPLGAAIKYCNHLELIQVFFCDDSLCHFLEQLPNPSSCSLFIGLCTLTSAGAVKLAYLLPKFENATKLNLQLDECSAEAVTRLVAAIKKHKTLKKLELSKINLTSAVAESLELLPELSALQRLTISGSDAGCRFSLEFPDPSLSLRIMTITGLTEYSAETATKFIGVIKHKTLDEVNLSVNNLTSVLAETLAQLLPEISALRELKISDLSECSAEAVTRLVADIENHNNLKELELSKINLTSAVAEALGQSLPELSALQTLTISGSDGCRLWLREYKRFCLREDKRVRLREDKSLSLPRLTIRGLTEYSAEAVTRIIDAIRHKTLNKVELTVFNLTSVLAEALVQLLPELSALQTLRIRDLTECSDEAVTKMVAAIKHKTLEQLELNNINLTLAVVEVLCQSLPELSTLRRLEICGADGCKLSFHCPGESKFVRALGITGLTESSAEKVTRVVDAIKHKRIDEMAVFVVNLTSASVEALAQLPELSALRRLGIGAMTDRSEEAVTKLVAAIKHVSLEELELNNINLTSAVVEALSQLLPELSALRKLCIRILIWCSDEAVTKLVFAIKYVSLVELELSGIHLSSAVAEALGQLLPELPALRTLEISGSDGCNLQHREMEAMFGRLNRPSSLRRLSITHFSARGSLSSLAKNLSFFPYLEKLQLSGLDMDEADLFGLLENLKYIPYLGHLYLMDNPISQAVRSMAPHLFKQNKLKKVYFRRGDFSEEDLNYVQKAVKEKRPQLSIEVIDLGTSISIQL